MKLVYGVGINDADYEVVHYESGKQNMCPAYGAWKRMLYRATSDKFHSRFPTYSSVSVCSEWKSFMKFREWWADHYVSGWHLDKDLVSPEKIYSPNSCVYIPAWLNIFTINKGAKRGEFPLGVYFHKKSGKFMARCNHPITGDYGYLGLFDNPIDGHVAWKNRKLDIAFETKCHMDAIDERIYPGVVRIISEAV